MARKIIKPQKINIEVTDIPKQSVIGDEVIPTQIQTISLDDQDDSIETIIENEQPKAVNIMDRTENRLEHCDPIPDIETLKEKLIKLGIRFDTDPKLYQKPDYWLLVCILYRALIHLYESNPEDIIVTDWLDPHSDDYIPSEKLVAETIEELEGNLSQEVLDRIQSIADEAALRLQGDQNLQNTKQDKLIAGPGISIVDNVISNTNLSAEWGNIAGNLEDQEDLQEALDEKANLEDIPTNVSELNNDVGYLTTETDPTVSSWAKQPSKPIYTASEVGALPDDTFIPEKTSDLTNDSGFITSTDITGKEDKSNKVTSISSSSTNTQYPSAKCVYDEFTTTVMSDDVSSVGDITVYTNLNIQVIDKTQDSSSTFAIDPNKMYMFGTRTSLTITLNPGESGIVNEYMFQFTSGSVATTLNVPSSVTWLKDPNIQTGKKYLVSIENNLGIIGEWENE